MQRYFNINAEGHSIHCKLYSNDSHGAGRMILYGHGFGGHMDNRTAEKFADRLLSKYKDAAMVVFNWPCHGNDVKKKLLLSDCDAYLRLVAEHMKREMGARELYGYATSFGGYMFLRYASRWGSPFVRMALRCPVIDLYESLTQRIMTPENLEALSKGKDALVGFDRKIRVNPQFLADVKDAPMTHVDMLEQAEDILILHGTQDEIVPIEMSRAFADENIIEFVPVEGADHRFQKPEHMEAATKRILEFFAL